MVRAVEIFDGRRYRAVMISEAYWTMSIPRMPTVDDTSHVCSPHGVPTDGIDILRKEIDSVDFYQVEEEEEDEEA